MFKIVMIIAVVGLAIGWIAYGIYALKMRAEEKKQPRQESKRLQKSKSEIAEWAQKMAKFKKPTHKPEEKKNNTN
jgi:uncharacterized membrane protein YciS (DUF1049 family)